jgi:AAA15 family ATPase/GTPase
MAGEEKEKFGLIQEFKISEGYILDDEKEQGEKQNEFLGGFKRLNIFVGANNSGKSHFLRKTFLSKEKSFFRKDDLQQVLEDVKKEMESSMLLRGKLSIVNEILGDLKYINLEGDDGTGTRRLLDNFNEFVEEVEREMDGEEIYQNLHEILGKFKKGIRLYPAVYIPILRGIHGFHLLKNLQQNHPGVLSDEDPQLDIYLGALLKRVRAFSSFNMSYESFNKTGGASRKEIFTGLSFYSKIKHMYLGNRKQREEKKAFEKFVTKYFFPNRDIVLVPDSKEEVVKIDILDNKDVRPVPDLGDGTQSIIINTFPLFQYGAHKEGGANPLVLFIEEPEMMMHPSMQRVLVETFMDTEKFPNVQVFLTTHSNHFLDLLYDYPDDVAIFSFQDDEKEPEKKHIRNIGGNSRVLDLLGVRNSSVYLSNCVIWTEGVTERMLLRMLFKDFTKITKNYKEDRHYTFAEYGGANLDNFDFCEDEAGAKDGVDASVKALGKRNFIIADNDGEKEGEKAERRKRLERLLGEENFFDAGYEIENLIPFVVWKKVVEEICGGGGKKIKIKEDLKTSDESDFDKRLASEPIGKLLREYLICVRDKKMNPVILKKIIYFVSVFQKEWLWSAFKKL